MASEKKLIQDGYNDIAEPYLDWALQHPSARLKYLDELLENVSQDSHVLELGCGAGTPILEKLVQRVSTVTGNDISEKQIELARARCPQATLVRGDMTVLQFPPSTFDGVAAFYSVIHLPRNEQPVMLSLIRQWLKPGGIVVFNLATTDQEGIYQKFFGASMFWSSYDVETSKKMVETAGFQLMKADILGSGEGLDPSDPDYGIEFLWIVARKVGS